MNRDDFSIFKNNNVVYFDNGATTLKPKCVRDAIIRYYDEYTANGANYEREIVDLTNLEKVINNLKEFVYMFHSYYLYS